MIYLHTYLHICNPYMYIYMYIQTHACSLSLWQFLPKPHPSQALLGSTCTHAVPALQLLTKMCGVSFRTGWEAGRLHSPPPGRQPGTASRHRWPAGCLLRCAPLGSLGERAARHCLERHGPNVACAGRCLVLHSGRATA